MADGEVDAIAPTEQPPHPIDRALIALDDAVTLLVASGKPTRFAEIARLTTLAQQLQLLRPAAGVDDAVGDDGNGMGHGGGIVMMNGANLGGLVAAPPRRFNDTADLSREMLMLAQSFLKSYAETEKVKADAQAARNQLPIDVRIDVVAELTELMILRNKLVLDNAAPVPEEITRRITHLLQRIGEPPHDQPEPQQDPVVHPEPLRGHPPDGAGGLDGDRVGEPLAERA